MESHFETKPALKVRHIAQVKKGWFRDRIKIRQAVILEKELHYYSELLRKWVIVPADYISDGASVPQIFWSLFPPFGVYLYAAVVHDYLIELSQSEVSPIDSATAHAVFDEAMEICKTHGLTKWCMDFAVSWFGPKYEEDMILPSDVDISEATCGPLITQAAKRVALV